MTAEPRRDELLELALKRRLANDDDEPRPNF